MEKNITIQWAGPISYAALNAALADLFGDKYRALASWDGLYTPLTEDKLPGTLTVIVDESAPDLGVAIYKILHAHDPVFITVSASDVALDSAVAVSVYVPLVEAAPIVLDVAGCAVPIVTNQGQAQIYVKAVDPIQAQISLNNPSNRSSGAYVVRFGLLSGSSAGATPIADYDPATQTVTIQSDVGIAARASAQTAQAADQATESDVEAWIEANGGAANATKLLMSIMIKQAALEAEIARLKG